MKAARRCWLRMGAEVRSYRQMYSFADRIIASSEASREDRQAAYRVRASLSDIIDKPIAEAARLARARERFGGLLEVLRTGTQ